MALGQLAAKVLKNSINVKVLKLFYWGLFQGLPSVNTLCYLPCLGHHYVNFDQFNVSELLRGGTPKQQNFWV